MAFSTSELPLGTVAPNFALLDTVSDRLVSLHDVASKKATVIMFMSNHCPQVQHVLPKLISIAREYRQQEVNFVAINANDAESFPEDGPQQMKALARELNFPFPYLYDQTQQVARTFHAVCTPEFYVFDRNMRLAYHGQFDSSRPKTAQPITGQDLTQALEELLAGQAVSHEQKPGVGCGIKWKGQSRMAG
ncbi:thioredoxin family protein [Pontibacter ruber]|uniref:Thioredoxin family protein n=1 Tax=Pontibacter ruber TaxID=1343895 RepID=A0ABW5D1D2_9BACT|nr:thioredoxin family protein [Pontibacter ruber]